MGKIKDYTVEAAKALDKITCSDADTNETKNITVEGIGEALDVDGSWTTTTVDISSAQLLALNSTPVNILDAPGDGKYYEYRARLEYTFGGTAYTVSGGGYLYLDQGNPDAYFSAQAITQSEDATSFAYSIMANINQPVVLTSASNPTTGNGTVRLVVQYKIRTHGV